MKQLHAKKYFLTISQTEDKEPKHVLATLLKNPIKPLLESALVAKETHKNGGFHFHLLLAFQKKKKFNDHTAFNFLLNKQANIQTVRNTKDVVEYIVKDNNYVS
jgi:hypothetical protein